MPDKRLSVDSVLEGALSADVVFMLLTGTSVEASAASLALAHQHPHRLFSTAGVHPHNAKDVSADFNAQLTRLARDPHVLAIGECGLDFNRNFSPVADQMRVFEQQLELACTLQLPVFLHERDAFDQQLGLLDKYIDDLVGGVAHCFTGNTQQMQAYLDRGLYIGVTGWVCDPKRGRDLRDAIADLPLSRVLLETDAPYLMPKTLKNAGNTNVPANLPHIAQQVAQCMSQPLSTLQQASWHNSQALFKFPREDRVDAL